MIEAGPKQGRELAPVLLAVALLALLAYASNLPNGFAMDDRYNVVANTQLDSLANIPQLFT